MVTLNDAINGQWKKNEVVDGISAGQMYNAFQNPRAAIMDFASDKLGTSPSAVESGINFLSNPNPISAFNAAQTFMPDAIDSLGRDAGISGFGGDVGMGLSLLSGNTSVSNVATSFADVAVDNLINDAIPGIGLASLGLDALGLGCINPMHIVDNLVGGVVGGIFNGIGNLFGGGRQSKELDCQDANAVNQLLDPSTIARSGGQSIDQLAGYVHSVECSDKGGHEKWQQNDDISNRIKDMSDKTSDPAQKASLRKLYDGIQSSFHHDGGKSADQIQKEAFATYKQETMSQMGGCSRGSRSQNYGNSGCGNAYMPNNMSSAGLSPALSFIIKEALNEKAQAKAYLAAAEQAVALQLMQSQNTQKNHKRHKHHHHKDNCLNAANNLNNGGVKVIINI